MIGKLSLMDPISQTPHEKSFRLFRKHEWQAWKSKKSSMVHCTAGKWKGQKQVADPVRRMVTLGEEEMTSRVDNLTKGHESGIGLVKYFQGKTILITGATGFLAKVLVEKILRSMPDTSKIYLMIKARDEEAAMQRMKTEIINAELFNCLKQKYGTTYQNFMLSKLVPVVGDVCEPDMGLDEHMDEVIVKEVDVIVNSAATTAFDERYDVSICVNTRGPCHLINFAKKCKQLKLFLQISTAYANGQRKGIIMEKPFSIGDCITRENSESTAAASLPAVDVLNEIKLALNAKEAFQQSEVASKMKELGLDRARKYGWQNTYVFSKAMGEMLIDNMRGDIPVVIIRPSVVESTCSDPIPGWIEGNKVLDPLAWYYGKGQLKGFVADPNGIVDVVPADMVVNATIAAIARHGMEQKSGINIYQIASSVVNPLVFKDLFTLFYEHYSCSPHMDSNGQKIQVTPWKHFTSMEDFSAHLWEEMIRQNGFIEMNSHGRKLSKNSEFLSRKFMEHVKHLAEMYEPFTFYAGRFDNTNTEMLMEGMAENEKRNFGFDVKSIDWKDYIKNVHIPGLRRHAMKGRGMGG